jgi:hypothetical protein
MRNLRFVRLLSVAGAAAAAVLFGLAASNAVFDQNGDIGWGLFCLAVAALAHYVETNRIFD